MTTLLQTYKAAVRNGGAGMDPKKYTRVFGNNSAQRSNVLRACAHESFGTAIANGTVSDHRVVPPLLRMGDVAATIVLRIEHKLKRKLSRERAQALAGAFLAVRERAAVPVAPTLYLAYAA